MVNYGCLSASIVSQPQIKLENCWGNTKEGATFKGETNFVQNYAFKGGKARALSFNCKTDRADFIDWICFRPSNFMEEFSPNPRALSANASSLSSTKNS